jgi:hypothetical protein
MTEETSSYPTEDYTGELVTSGDPETQNPKMPNALGTSVASPAAGFGGSPVPATGTGVPIIPITRRQHLTDDIVPHVYPKYFNHSDAAAHVKQFRSIWAVTHGMQGLTPMEREQFMIVQF